MGYFPSHLDLDLLALCNLVCLCFAFMQGIRISSTHFLAKLGHPNTRDRSNSPSLMKIWILYDQRATSPSCSLSSSQKELVTVAANTTLLVLNGLSGCAGGKGEVMVAKLDQKA